MNECMNKSDRLKILSPYADKLYEIVTVAANGVFPMRTCKPGQPTWWRS